MGNDERKEIEDRVFAEFLAVSGIKAEFVKHYTLMKKIGVADVDEEKIIKLKNYALGVWLLEVPNAVMYFPKEDIPVETEGENV